MPLNLLDRSTPQSVFNAGISVDNMSWWFWVKAGIGLGAGVSVVVIVGSLFWVTIGWKIWLILFARSFR